MPETLQSSTVGDVVTLPDDNADPGYDTDFDFREELAQDWRNYDRWVGLALADYNARHGTDYENVKPKTGKTLLFYRESMSMLIHCGITATPSKDVECESAAKHFCADLDEDTEEVLSCRIVDGLDDPNGCKFCFIRIPERSPSPDPAHCDPINPAKPVREGIVVPPSQYSYYLGLVVSVYDEGYKFKFPSLALAYYNKKQRKDYKLVDALSGCVTHYATATVVAHCNFFARQTAHDDAPNKLFFAELEKRMNGVWVVRCCRVIQGKTKVGCHSCVDHKGKSVIHPSRGFRFGLYPNGDGSRLGGRRRGR